MTDLNAADAEAFNGPMGVAADRDGLFRLQQLNDRVEELPAGVALSCGMAPVRHWVIRFVRMQRKDVPEEYRFADAREHPPNHFGGTFTDGGTLGRLLYGQPAEQFAVGIEMHF